MKHYLHANFHTYLCCSYWVTWIQAEEEEEEEEEDDDDDEEEELTNMTFANILT